MTKASSASLPASTKIVDLVRYRATLDLLRYVRETETVLTKMGIIDNGKEVTIYHRAS